MKMARLSGAVCACLLGTSITASHGAIGPPSLGSPDQFVVEDGSLTLSISAAPNKTDGSEFITLTVSNIDTTWGVDTFTSGGTYNALTGVWTLTAPAGASISGGPTFTPPANSDADLGSLVATVVSTKSATGETASTTDNFTVLTDAVADASLITANDVSGFANAPIGLDVTASLTDLDGSEEITKYIFSDLLSGSTFSTGTDLGGGLWEITAAELTGLSLFAPTDYTGSFDLMAKVISEEVNLSGFDIDSFNNVCDGTGIVSGYPAAVCSTDTFTVTVSTVPVPPAVWLFVSGILGLIGLGRRNTS